jgi:alkylation response protein AidB-like acyl-CoA dehydrogenase
MDLNLTPEEKQFRDELRAWLGANVPKDWREWRAKPIEESFPYLRAWQEKLHEGRWAAVSWPKEYGGRGATLMQQTLFWKEMARVELLGPYGQLQAGDPLAADKGIWSYGYLRARGNTIEAGTSEVQRNIIGHFVLGLPRSY